MTIVVKGRSLETNPTQSIDHMITDPEAMNAQDQDRGIVAGTSTIFQSAVAEVDVVIEAQAVALGTIQDRGAIHVGLAHTHLVILTITVGDDQDMIITRSVQMIEWMAGQKTGKETKFRRLENSQRGAKEKMGKIAII
jgi:hypothetical protein